MFELAAYESFMQESRRKGADESELFMLRAKSLDIDVRSGRVENLDEKEEFGLGLRVIVKKKLGFSFTSDLSSDSISETIDAAVAHARVADEDPHVGLPTAPRQTPTFPCFDPQLADLPIQNKIALAFTMEQSAHAVSPRIKRTDIVRFHEAEIEVAIVSSRGISAQYRKNYCGGFADVIAEEDGKAENGFGMQFAARFAQFDAAAVGKEAGEEANAFLGAAPVPTGKYALLLHPAAAVSILGFLVQALSAEAVQKGKSPFRNKIGTKISSSALTLIDNGHLADAVGSQPFDTEGVPSPELTLVRQGVLHDFLFHTHAANREKRQSNGHAERGSFKSIPVIGPTNFYIEPGSDTADSIRQRVSRGVLLRRIIGAHTINPVSGDFSVGAAGYLIESGRVTRSVSGITLSGNLFEYLSRLEAVGNDLRFYPGGGNLGSPTLLIADAQIGGL